MIRTSMNFRSRRGDEADGVLTQDVVRTTGTAALLSTARCRQPFDHNAPAGLLVREARRLRYRHFELGSSAVRFANEELTPRQLESCTLEAGDSRYSGEGVRGMYLEHRYPLRRPLAIG